MESLILRYIKENADWRKSILSYGIKPTERGNLTIFNYTDIADWDNAMCREARGIIIDTVSNCVVCWPFTKFFNYNEPWADDIDWGTAQIQEKIDGSLIKLYYYNNQWQWATNKTINAETCEAGGDNLTFMDLIRSTLEYKQLDYRLLDPMCTYMFELVSPENQVEVFYNERSLYHIATRRNTDGVELDVNIGIRKPKTYKFDGGGVDYVKGLVDSLNTDSTLEHEGVVVVDSLYRRIKVKTSEYLQYSKTINNGNMTKKRMVNYINSTPLTEIDDFCTMFPQHAPIVRFYQYQIAEFQCNLVRYINLCRRLYVEFDKSRKTLALYMKGNKLWAFTFIGIDNDKTISELMADIKLSTILNHISDYNRNITEA